MTKSADEATLAFYASEAPDYVATGRGGINRHLDHFLTKLAPSSRVLELGCGSGRDAQAFLDAGHMVDATDGSAAMAAQAEARLGQPVQVMRFDQLEAVGSYDAVWASASLLHVPRAGLRDVLWRIHRALRPGGLHYASYKAGGAEGRDTLGRYYNYLTAAEAVTLYQSVGDWSVLEIFEYVGGGYDGAQGKWTALILEKPATR